MNNTNIVDLTQFALKMLGKKGGIKFDSNMADHQNDGSFDTNEDYFIIGKDDKPITKRHLKKFLKKLNKYINDPKFDNGRTYMYGGIYKGFEDRTYGIKWTI